MQPEFFKSPILLLTLIKISANISRRFPAFFNHPQKLWVVQLRVSGVLLLAVDQSGTMLSMNGTPLPPYHTASHRGTNSGIEVFVPPCLFHHPHLPRNGRGIKRGSSSTTDVIALTFTLKWLAMTTNKFFVLAKIKIVKNFQKVRRKKRGWHAQQR